MLLCNQHSECVLFVGFPFQTDSGVGKVMHFSRSIRFEAMDHFNATIQGGKLVKTRRGLQVSRQKHNGLSFVNASPQEKANDSGAQGTTSTSASAQHEIRFVEDGSESQSEGSSQRDIEYLGPSVVGQLTKRRRKAIRRSKSPTPSGPGTSFRSSPAPFEGQNAQVEDRKTHRSALQIISLAVNSPAAGVSGDTTPDFESALSEHDQAMLDRCLDLNPSVMYPYEDILAHNPARESDFRAMVLEDRAALHCTLMWGSIARAISARSEPRDLAHHISNICAILNQKLSQSHAVGAVTMHCIATLACVGVCAVSNPEPREGEARNS